MGRQFWILLILLAAASNISAQIGKDEIFPRLSPNASVSQSLGYTTIIINYCRPAVLERKIWGALVPFNQVWRTGANEATTIQFTTDVIIGGAKVAAGRYSLFTIPAENEWTIILNKVDDQWGAFLYNPKDDLLRFKVKPEKATYFERLQFSFSHITDNSVTVDINWESLQISFRIEIDLAGQAFTKIKEILATKPGDAKIYYKSAEYAADHDFLLNEALQWADKAISIEPSFYAHFIKAKILFKQTKFIEAQRALDKCREAGRNDKDIESYSALIDMLENQIKAKIK